jgi:hypothetical protein
MHALIMCPLKCSGRDDGNTWRNLKDACCKREPILLRSSDFPETDSHVLRVLEGDRDFCGGIEIRRIREKSAGELVKWEVLASSAQNSG